MKNFTKWLAFSFPYLAQLLNELINWYFQTYLNIDIGSHNREILFILINSTSILFGIKLIQNYTHKDNCKNYLPNDNITKL